MVLILNNNFNNDIWIYVQIKKKIKGDEKYETKINKCRKNSIRVAIQ